MPESVVGPWDTMMNKTGYLKLEKWTNKIKMKYNKFCEGSRQAAI